MLHLILLGIVYVSFISLGLPDGILGVAWPAIRADMGQPLAAVGAITIAMTISSATASYFAGAIAKRVGTGAVVATSCLMTALALIGFAYAPSFGWLVALAVPLGLGAGAVDASLNHFVAAHYSSRHMNWLHGFWGVGATTGPLIMGLALASSTGWTCRCANHWPDSARPGRGAVVHPVPVGQRTRHAAQRRRRTWRHQL